MRDEGLETNVERRKDYEIRAERQETMRQALRDEGLEKSVQRRRTRDRGLEKKDGRRER